MFIATLFDWGLAATLTYCNVMAGSMVSLQAELPSVTAPLFLRHNDTTLYLSNLPIDDNGAALDMSFLLREPCSE